jgi:polyisoprenoid-binding protein YceI
MMEALKIILTHNNKEIQMKNLIATVLALSSMSAFSQTYKVDPTSSKIVYVGKKVTGEHTGTITLKSGSISVKGDEITNGEFVADMNSLSSTDITDPEYNKKYVGHMTSPDFFDTAKYPESKLVINSSKKTAKGLEVKGNLTLLGQTKPVSFIVTDIKKTDTEFSGKSNLALNRTNWGLKYGSTSFFKGLGDKAINDEFTLAVEISAKK